MAIARPRTPGVPAPDSAPTAGATPARSAAPRPARRRRIRPLTTLAAGLGLAAGSLGLWSAGGSAAADTAAGLPAPDHVVVVVLENHAYSQVIGSPDAPYINDTLVAGGAQLTQSHALTHPSQPNYYALFSGSTQGIVDDSCVHVGALQAPNLASELLAAGQTWASYNEGLPQQGATDCRVDNYAQKHNPWFGFGNVPTDSANTMDAFPTDFSTLPKVSFVVPDLCDDMHDCSVGTGDSWLQSNLDAYAQWAKSNNSLLVVTFDENDGMAGNRIPTLVYGAHVTPGSSTATTYNHYDVLHTLEDLAGLDAHAGNSAGATDITGIWN
ncbi:alkaline phosphatase family protein [Kitasatospora sp. NPDC101447]|uniref:alkaline phosphatase family protein n=1 Tax=Kitasatospora sp. NPDC101447 TaxID=3364102 RepID=UPI0037F9AD22